MVGLLALVAFIWALGLVAIFAYVWPFSRPWWAWFGHSASDPPLLSEGFATGTWVATSLLAAALAIVASFGGRQVRFHIAFFSGLTLLIVTWWCARYTIGDAGLSAARGISELGGLELDRMDARLAAAIPAVLFGGSSAVFLLLTALCLDREPGLSHQRFR
jgi:hypothetical protein